MSTQDNASEAWDGYVGAQSPAEFMMLSVDKDAEGAVAGYIHEARDEMFADLNAEELARVGRLLVQYIEAHAEESTD